MLSTIKVLDLTRIFAGPYCTMLLADLGANVYKIERPDGGDGTRSWGPPFHHGESCYFLSVNRNKKSVAVDLKNPEGTEIIKNLAKKCDIFVEDYLPGHLKTFGLDYMSLKIMNPGLVYCSLTGYGQKGPLAQRPGHDVVVASVGGLHGAKGPNNENRVEIAFTDICTGLYAYGSILAALLSRYHSDLGTHIDANSFATQTAFLSHIAASWLNCGIDYFRSDSGNPSTVPCQSFSTSDERYVVIAVGDDAAFQTLCQVLNLSDLPLNEKFASKASRVNHRDELGLILQKRFSENTSDHWERVFATVHFPFGRVNSISEALALAFNHNPNAFIEIENETKNKRVLVTGPAVEFSRKTFIRESHSFPPRLGENTFSVLGFELSYSKEKLNALQKRGVILQCD